jgi:hypothetical protein
MGVVLNVGLGFILIEVLRNINPGLIDYHNAVFYLPIGILLVFVSLGFPSIFSSGMGRKNDWRIFDAEKGFLPETGESFVFIRNCSHQFVLKPAAGILRFSSAFFRQAAGR